MSIIKITENPKDFGDVFSCKILCTNKAYKDIKNSAYTWQDQSSSYCLWGDNLTLTGVPNKEFIQLISPKTILCSRENALALSLNILQEGEVMSKKILGDKKPISPMFLDGSKQVFELLKENDMANNYEDFLLDTSLKLRKSLGTLECAFDEKKLIALVLSSYINDNNAIITAVVTDKNYRQQNFAKKLIQKIENKLCGRTIFLLKEKYKNDEFYKKLGYQKIDDWVLGERQ